jgi:hypothetical protein
MPGADPKAARRIMCPNCKSRVQQGQAMCSHCGISLVSGSYETKVSGTFAVRDTSGINPRLFMLILVIGLGALIATRGPHLTQDVLGLVNHVLHTNFQP